MFWLSHIFTRSIKVGDKETEGEGGYLFASSFCLNIEEYTKSIERKSFVLIPLKRSSLTSLSIIAAWFRV